MLVEDHSEMRATLRTLLESSGQLQVVAESASIVDTLEHPALNSVQLLILDLRLTDGSGMDCALAVRQTHPALPILFLSATADSVSENARQRVGHCRVSSKFAAPAVLLQEVLETLDS